LRELGPHDASNRQSTPADPGRVAIVSRKLDVPTHPQGHELLAFWQQRRHNGELLHKRDVPTRGIHRLLPYLTLYEPVDAQASDWRCRVIGSAILERLEMRDVKGKTLAEVHSPEIASSRATTYKQVVDRLTPNIARGRIIGTGREFLEIEVIHLPVRASGQAVWILGAMFFFN
jgi:hypothetical protein